MWFFYYILFFNPVLYFSLLFKFMCKILIDISICSQAVRQDNKQRFSLLEENGELLIRANQGHSLVVIYLMKDCRGGRIYGLSVKKKSEVEIFIIN